jgi:hypothetical protein
MTVAIDELNAPGKAFRNAFTPTAHIPVSISTMGTMRPLPGETKKLSGDFWRELTPGQENTLNRPANLLDNEKIIC